MKEELNLECPYKIFKDTKEGYYYFFTKSNIKYSIYFLEASSYFNDFELKENVFHFGFDKLSESNNRFLSDEGIRLTIVEFIKHFFSNKNRVLTFVADISDLKHKARNRLFNMWKNTFDENKEFEKYNVEIESETENEQKIVYFASMIIHQSNKRKQDYIDSFFSVKDDLNKND